MPIGFFDSGVGGISVLKKAIKLMPEENYIYFGDSINAPYGTKAVEEVRRLTYKSVELLLDKGAKAIVIACNTATSAAVADLRKTYPDIPIVGIEPAVKPAVEMKRDGDIIIMATPVTLKEKKFHRLMEKYEKYASIVPMPCPGLMDLVEKGTIKGPEVQEYLKEKFLHFNNKKIAAVVLGCTHYPFVAEEVANIIGKDIPIIDGGLGTSKELRRRLIEKDLLTDSKEKGRVDLYNSLNKKNMIEISKFLLNS